MQNQFWLFLHGHFFPKRKHSALSVTSIWWFKVWSKVFPSSHRGAVQHSITGLSLVRLEWQAEVCFFLLPQSRSEEISPRFASNHPYHTRKRQQYREFNDRSNCCGSPTLCCGGVMNDSCNAPRCEEIAAAWSLFKPICHGCNFPVGLLCWGKWLDFKEENEEKFLVFFLNENKKFSLMKIQTSLCEFCFWSLSR